MGIKILAAADLHLGKESSGLVQLGEVCSTRNAWKRIVRYAIDNAVDVLVLAGDLIDRDNRYYEASGSLQEGFRNLGDAGIVVYVVAGNHDFDVLPQVLKNNPFPHVHLLGENGQWQALRLERGGEMLQVIGWSFPTQHFPASPLPGLAGLSLDPNCFHLGVLHAEVVNLESNYAPVRFLDLQNAPVDAWILGHIHKPTVFAGDKLIRYPGSCQSLSAKEQGVHGGFMFTIEERRITRVEEVVISTCRFERLQVDVSSVDSKGSFRGLMGTELSAHANSFLEQLEGALFLVYDIELTGRNNRRQELQQWLDELRHEYEGVMATGTKVLIRTAYLNIRPAVSNLETLAGERSLVGLLAQTILALREGSSTPFLEQLISQWDTKFRQITYSNVFEPLQMGFQQNGNTRTAREFIEEECNRLLGELLFPAN